ncbi:MAG: CotH kinase family protein, partial [candidate division KSB1 bacterium]|nr:CotH kinase family protein [candidate division KSB1 bacterium]
MNTKRTFAVLIWLMVPAMVTPAMLEDESWKVFDDSVVGEARIIIAPTFLNFLLDPSNAHSDSLFPATFVYKNAAIAGDSVLLVGVRLRGNTSRFSAKKSFKVDFNHFVPGRKFYDLEKMNLNGEHNDPSIMRSKLCWDLFQQIRVPASRANYVRLYINDKYFGLYMNVEHVDDEFVQKRFGNQNGNLYKCLYPADLVYLGADQQPYKKFHGDRQAYELMTNKDQNDYSDLVHFIDVVNNTPAARFKTELEKVFNVDNFLKWLALNVLVGSWDDYWYLKNNYYLYHNTATDKFEFIPYDYDNTYGIDWVGSDWATRNIYRWGNMQEKRPLVTRIMELPEYRYRYTLYLETFMNNEFCFEAQQPRIDQLKAMITPAVAADSFRILDWDFSISDFHQSFETSVPTKYNHVPYGIKPYIKLRIASATAQLATFYPPPVVINEFMASNKRTIADEHGEYDDWIELYNTDSQPFNV